uniref:Myocardin n=1 Tax=Oryzias melastigma TaxID=30732 RepID=A0A3B3DY16_ORYME
MTLLGSEHSILIRRKFRSVLQFRLQQRRAREQLADQGIMPREYPPELTHTHTHMPSGRLRGVSAGRIPQLALKLCSKYVQLRLTNRVLFDLLAVNHGKFPKQEDSYAFEEDSSSESLSPEHPHSDESQGSACPSSEPVGSTASSSSSPALTSTQQVKSNLCDLFECLPSLFLCCPPVSKTSDKNRHKKPKDVKPKVKKLKYHQYIPPDQKAEKSPPPMDSAYARLLQQQQLFLQLQILSQQKHSQSQQQNALTPNLQDTSILLTTLHSGSSPIKTTYPNQSSVSPVKPGPLPANLDDLKVSELRQHLRIRGMPVSGTKTALIERLRPFKDLNAEASPPGSSDITTLTFPVTPSGSLCSYQSPSSSSTLSQGGYYPYPSTSSTPPISPASSELSLSGSLPDSFSDVPMSSPTQFGLQPSPVQFGMEDGHGGAGSSGGETQRTGESGDGEGVEADKDKMLVEKQKVIEELTWKLHQEQRQVREHLRRPQQTPSMMGQHFFGVTVKQESVSSSCPLSSPKQLKNPPDTCMESMGHCNSSITTMGGPAGPQCMETGHSSGSPSTMSAFLSPQCSPQDSPIRKPSSGSQPSSPNNSYLLTPSMGRDGCGHPQSQSSNRARNMQVKPCFFPLQQLTRSQQMDELLDVLIESGEMPTNAREEREKVSVTKVVPHITVSPGCPGVLIPRFHWHYDHHSPVQLPYDHAANHNTESHLQTLLGNSVGRAGDMSKMMEGDRSQEDERNRDADGYSPQNHHCHSHHLHQDKLLTNRDVMDTPLSPLGNKMSSIPEVQGMVSMTFSETPWETMEWLDLTPPNSANAFNVAQPNVPSIFNTEFLDVTDINLNSAMDLHLEHW